MPNYEYRVVPAPTRGIKGKGIKGPEARFSHALQELMNAMGGEGWEYQRAETLPSVERSGLTSRTTEWRNVLVFRRARADSLDAFAPEPLPVPRQVTLQAIEKEPEIGHPAGPDDDASTSRGATRMLRDNGVEEVSDVAGITSSLKQLVANRSLKKTTD